MGYHVIDRILNYRSDQQEAAAQSIWDEKLDFIVSEVSNLKSSIKTNCNLIQECATAYGNRNNHPRLVIVKDEALKTINDIKLNSDKLSDKFADLKKKTKLG